MSSSIPIKYNKEAAKILPNSILTQKLEHQDIRCKAITSFIVALLGTLALGAGISLIVLTGPYLHGAAAYYIAGGLLTATGAGIVASDIIIFKAIHDVRGKIADFEGKKVGAELYDYMNTADVNQKQCSEVLERVSNSVFFGILSKLNQEYSLEESSQEDQDREDHDTAFRDKLVGAFASSANFTRIVQKLGGKPLEKACLQAIFTGYLETHRKYAASDTIARLVASLLFDTEQETLITMEPENIQEILETLDGQEFEQLYQIFCKLVLDSCKGLETDESLNDNPILQFLAKTPNSFLELFINKLKIDDWKTSEVFGMIKSVFKGMTAEDQQTFLESAMPTLTLDHWQKKEIRHLFSILFQKLQPKSQQEFIKSLIKQANNYLSDESKGSPVSIWFLTGILKLANEKNGPDKDAWINPELRDVVEDIPFNDLLENLFNLYLATASNDKERKDYQSQLFSIFGEISEDKKCQVLKKLTADDGKALASFITKKNQDNIFSIYQRLCQVNSSATEAFLDALPLDHDIVKSIIGFTEIAPQTIERHIKTLISNYDPDSYEVDSIDYHYIQYFERMDAPTKFTYLLGLEKRGAKIINSFVLGYLTISRLEPFEEGNLKAISYFPEAVTEVIFGNHMENPKIENLTKLFLHIKPQVQKEIIVKNFTANVDYTEEDSIPAKFAESLIDYYSQNKTAANSQEILKHLYNVAPKIYENVALQIAKNNFEVFLELLSMMTQDKKEEILNAIEAQELINLLVIDALRNSSTIEARVLALVINHDELGNKLANFVKNYEVSGENVKEVFSQIKATLLQNQKRIYDGYCSSLILLGGKQNLDQAEQAALTKLVNSEDFIAVSTIILARTPHTFNLLARSLTKMTPENLIKYIEALKDQKSTFNGSNGQSLFAVYLDYVVRCYNLNNDEQAQVLKTFVNHSLMNTETLNPQKEDKLIIKMLTKMEDSALKKFINNLGKKDVKVFDSYLEMLLTFYDGLNDDVARFIKAFLDDDQMADESENANFEKVVLNLRDRVRSLGVESLIHLKPGLKVLIKKVQNDRTRYESIKNQIKHAMKTWDNFEAIAKLK